MNDREKKLQEFEKWWSEWIGVRLSHTGPPFGTGDVKHAAQSAWEAAIPETAVLSDPSDYFRGQHETVKYLLSLKPEQVHQALLDMQTGMDATLKAPQ